MCDKRLDFIIFRDWALSNGYKDNLEIDRIGNNGDYEPLNCRWVSHQENAQNRSTSKFNKQQVEEIIKKYITEKYTYEQLANEYNVSNSTIRRIINNKRWTNIKDRYERNNGATKQTTS